MVSQQQNADTAKNNPSTWNQSKRLSNRIRALAHYPLAYRLARLLWLVYGGGSFCLTCQRELFCYRT